MCMSCPTSDARTYCVMPDALRKLSWQGVCDLCHDTYDVGHACYKDAWIAARYGIQCRYVRRLCSSRSCCLGLLSRGDSRVDLLAILPSDTGRGSTVAATLTRTDTDDCMISSLIRQVFTIMIICRYTPCEWIAHETQYAILM